MERLIYFLEKFWVTISSINPFIILILVLISGLFFWGSKKLLLKYYPTLKRKNLISVAVTLLIGIPIIGSIFYLTTWLILKNQPF